jgi:antirestriction protein ArdC
VTPEPRDDHASYLASWLKVLKSDSWAIFTAADYLDGLQAFDQQSAAA